VGKGERPTSEVRAPAGIDYLVSLAARDPRFGKRLVEDPLRAARRAGLRLTDSERAVLTTLPREQLQAVIDNATPSPVARRSFLQRAALWMVGLFGGVTLTTMTGCPVVATRGVAPDVPPPREEPGGEQGDSPPPRGESEEDEETDKEAPGPVTGIRPDVPPPKDD